MQQYMNPKLFGSKSDFDKFYTTPGIAEYYLSMLNLDHYDTIIEPSSGNGAFSSLLPQQKSIALDIAPEHPGILQADWLTFDKTVFQGKVLVVGNPPFGINGNLALQFLHASSFADTIAFILPRGFKKISVKNRIPLNFHLTFEEDVPKNAFMLHNEQYDVPCVFQVWEKSSILREKVNLRKESEFVKFVPLAEHLTADFLVQRVGRSAGKAFLNLNVAPTANYFLQNTSSISTPVLMECINELSYPSLDHTTGPKSLPKGEFIQCLEEDLVKRGFHIESM